MRRAVLVDAGPLYAYIDADDTHHQRCAEFLASHDGTLIIPQLVITEVCYLVQTRLGTQAELLFLGDLASGAFSVEAVAAADWFRVIELVDTYRDFPLARSGRLGRRVCGAAADRRGRNPRSPALPGGASHARQALHVAAMTPPLAPGQHNFRRIRHYHSGERTTASRTAASRTAART